MNKEELRIGNMVLFDNQIVTVAGISTDFDAPYYVEIRFPNAMFTGVSIEKIQPMPITEEWMEEVGFEISVSNKHIYTTQAIGKYFEVLLYKNPDDVAEEYKHLNYKDFIVSFYTYYNDVTFYSFKYIHQIQNIFHALIGEEINKKSNAVT